MPRPVHFEIPAENPQRAINFCSTVFGWKFTKWDDGPMEYWMVETGPASEPGQDRRDGFRQWRFHRAAEDARTWSRLARLLKGPGRAYLRHHANDPAAK
jgi:predicted enzyme related to lactoylglutathione lyase